MSLQPCRAGTQGGDRAARGSVWGMSFYLARLEAARQQHQTAAAVAVATGHAHAPRAWPPYHYQHAGLLPRPAHHPPVPPPLHAGIRVVDTWRGAGGVARRDDGAGSLGVGARAGSATAREETGGEVRNKRPLALAPTTPRPRSPPPKRRAVAASAAARRLFPPGCGRDAALPLAGADGDDSRSVAARGHGGSGAPHKPALPPRPALAGAKVDRDSVSEAASPSSPSAANCLVPSARLLPKPTTVSGNRRFPPGCRSLGAPLPTAEDSTNQAVCLPSPEEEVVLPAERDDMEFVARPGVDTADDGAARNEGSLDGSNTLEAQESQVSYSATLNHATACVVEAYASHTSSGERIVVAESSAQDLSKELDRSESVPECAALNTTCSDDFAAAVSSEGALMRKKVVHTPRKSVRPPRLIQKTLLSRQCRPFSKEIEMEAKVVGWSVTMNDIEDTGVFTQDRAIQEPMSANKSPCRNGKEAAFFGPKKRVSKKKKLKNKRRVTVKHRTSACALDGKEDSILEDDEIFKALAAHETKFEYGPQISDARSKVQLICTRFESICRAIVQAAGHRSMKVRRIDLAA